MDFGLHRTMTCTFSFIDVLLLEKEAFKEAELLLGVGSSVGVLGGVGIVKSAMLSKKTEKKNKKKKRRIKKTGFILSAIEFMIALDRQLVVNGDMNSCDR